MSLLSLPHLSGRFGQFSFNSSLKKTIDNNCHGEALRDDRSPSSWSNHKHALGTTSVQIRNAGVGEMRAYVVSRQHSKVLYNSEPIIAVTLLIIPE